MVPEGPGDVRRDQFPRENRPGTAEADLPLETMILKKSHVQYLIKVFLLLYIALRLSVEMLP